VDGRNGDRRWGGSSKGRSLSFTLFFGGGQGAAHCRRESMSLWKEFPRSISRMRWLPLSAGGPVALSPKVLCARLEVVLHPAFRGNISAILSAQSTEESVSPPEVCLNAEDEYYHSFLDTHRQDRPPAAGNPPATQPPARRRRSDQERVAWLSLPAAMEGPRKTPKDTKRKGCDFLVAHPARDPATFRNPFSFRAFSCLSCTSNSFLGSFA